MTTAQKLTIELIRYEITDIPVSEELLSDISDELIAEVYAFSTQHDIGYIVGSALHKLNLLSGDAQTVFFNEQLASLYRYERIKYEMDCIIDLFEREKVKFILLKGAIIRNLYPKPEMRMSCDLDILLNPEDIERAGELLKTELSFSYTSQCGHEVNWTSPSGLTVELHFILLERDYKQKELLDKVWSFAQPIRDDGFQYSLTNEFFVFYHISHIAKHFLHGGCGIRQFLDLWFINSKLSYDKQELYRLLEEANLVKFANVAFDVSNSWFSGEVSANLPEHIEEYILNGGSYGSIENSIILEKNRSGSSKFKIFLQRVFVSRKTLQYLYPVTEKYPVLIPYFTVARWCRIIFKDRMKSQKNMIKAIANVSNEKQEKVKGLIKELGLSDKNEKNLEIEKKFIIKYPDIEFLQSLPECTHTEIEQIYLTGIDGKSERIRKRGLNGDCKYYHTVKYHITDMTRAEEERLISREEYEELKKRADSTLNTIFKTRYCLPFEGHIIEIDVFPFWSRQAYMEIELESEDEEFKVPGFIECICDVTRDRRYTNHSLAACIPEETL